MVDNAVNAEANYEYDANGNRIFEGYSSASANTGGLKTWYQQSAATYDALNRISSITDPRYTITYSYDAVGNRRRVLATYSDGLNGSLQTQDYWYQYDAANRFTVTMGQLVNGTVVAGSSGAGVTITYNKAGMRTQATYAYDNHREDYSYTADGQLTDVSINGVLRSRRYNDLAGRATRYQEWNANGSLKTDTSRIWDADSQLTREVDAALGTTTTYNRLADGTLSSSVQSDSAQSNGTAATTPTTTTTTTTSTTTYEWWDEAKQSTVKIQADNEANPRWAPGYSRMTYDQNGHLLGVMDVAANRGFSYGSDAEGHVLRRDENINGTKNRSHNYYFFDGHEVGNVGNDGIETRDYARELAATSQGSGPDQRFTSVSPVASADFDENYQPINSQYPGPVPDKYTVKAGDTLQGIAQIIWGDSQMWYLIADANGLDGTETLTTGVVLTLPNKVSNIHNTSSTWRPYQPGLAIGDTSPTLPAPPPPPQSDGGCGGMGQLLVSVISVAVAVAMQQYYLIGMSTPVAGAVAAATGSLAGQGVGVLTGMQDKFSLKQVGLAALSAGVSGSLSGIGPLDGELTSMGNTIARTALANTITQGAAVVLGLQDRFDLRGVVAAGAGAGVSKLLAGSFAPSNFTDVQFKPDLPTSIAQATLAGFAGALTTAALRGGHVSANQIATDAFGNALGNELADAYLEQQPAEQKRRDQQLAVRFAIFDAFGVDINTLPVTPAQQATGQGIVTGPSGPRFPEPIESAVGTAYITGNFQINRSAVVSATSELDLASAHDKWLQTGEKPIYDFGDPFATGGVGDLLAAGPGRLARPVQLARNANGDAAAQLVSDPFSLLGPGWANDYNGIGAEAKRNAIKQEIEEITRNLGQGARRVPDLQQALNEQGLLVNDYSQPQLERFRTFQNLENLRKLGIVELDENWAVKSITRNREMLINPREIRFTQEWVSYSKGMGSAMYTIDSIAAAVRDNPISLPAIDVVLMPDGKLTSLDNKRLTAASGVDAANIKIFIRDANEQLTAAEAKRFRSEVDGEKISPRTWGDATALRIFNQGDEFARKFRQGSAVVPFVNQAPVNSIWGLKFNISPIFRSR